MHLLIVQETIRRLLLGAARKDRRPAARPDAAPRPRPTAPDATASARRPGPNARTRAAPNTTRLPPRAPDTTPAPEPPAAATSPPNLDSRPRSHTPFGATGAADRRRPTRRPAHALPTRRTVAGRRTRRLHARLHQHRPNPVPRRPVRRQTTHRTPPTRATPSAGTRTEGNSRKRSLETTCPMCNPRVRSSQPRCASRGPNRNGADTKLRTPNTPDSASNRYVRRQPGGARPTQRVARLQKTTTQPALRCRVRHPAHRLRPTPPGCR